MAVDCLLVDILEVERELKILYHHSCSPVLNFYLSSLLISLHISLLSGVATLVLLHEVLLPVHMQESGPGTEKCVNFDCIKHRRANF